MSNGTINAAKTWNVEIVSSLGYPLPRVQVEAATEREAIDAACKELAHDPSDHLNESIYKSANVEAIED